MVLAALSPLVCIDFNKSTPLGFHMHGLTWPLIIPHAHASFSW